MRTVTELLSLAIERREKDKASILAIVEDKIINKLSEGSNSFSIYISRSHFDLIRGDMQNAGYNISFISGGRMGTPKMHITI
jgi:hypothetical protein